jgi:hypothetical protein
MIGYNVVMAGDGEEALKTFHEINRKNSDCAGSGEQYRYGQVRSHY